MNAVKAHEINFYYTCEQIINLSYFLTGGRMPFGGQRMHYGHQWCSRIWQTKTNAGIADVSINARNSIAFGSHTRGK